MINFMRERAPLAGDWELTWTAAGACTDARELSSAALQWLPASVPGTVAGALAQAAAAGGPHRPLPDEADLDLLDWWYRLRFDATGAQGGEEIVLALDGVATLSDVYVNGSRVLRSESMFAAHELDVGSLLTASNELLVCCRALAPALAQRRRPRARWRTRLVSEGSLRFVRTMLLGRAPGFAPSPPVVGIWRPVALERRQAFVVDRPMLRAVLDGDDGALSCSATLRALPGCELPDELPVTIARGTQSVQAKLTVQPAGDGVARCCGAIAVPGVQPWWPHTHGEAALYEVTIGAPASPLHRARVGFRTIQSPGCVESDGLQLHVNGVPVFVRGAVWTPPDLRAPDCGREILAPILERVVAAGMNMLRVHGTSTYESDAFYELCDELGILVWQDFMFANMDYPDADPSFMAAAQREAGAELQRLGHRPSLAVLCGSSEVDQQVAMLGLDRELAHGPLQRELLPRLVREAELDLPYVPSAPCGPELPFRYDRGVANYFGVGAYLRPLADARLAAVAFASECLAFANVPDDEALEALDAGSGLAVHHPAWKAGVPRDVGEGWDFDDVRDHYLQALFDVDPVALRWSDQARYLELSRAVTGEVM
ncbi:MAG: glycoside hydrolase family 2 protein, partial [Solirubrobacteraceae bacterium]